MLYVIMSVYQKDGLLHLREAVEMYPTDTMRGEDDGLWLQSFKSYCTFANIPQVLIRMRVNDDFYERRNSKEKTAFDYAFRKKIIRELRLPEATIFMSSPGTFCFAMRRYGSVFP